MTIQVFKFDGRTEAIRSRIPNSNLQAEFASLVHAR
jgi:hypothetical protein